MSRFLRQSVPPKRCARGCVYNTLVVQTSVRVSPTTPVRGGSGTPQDVQVPDDPDRTRLAQASLVRRSVGTQCGNPVQTARQGGPAFAARGPGSSPTARQPQAARLASESVRYERWDLSDDVLEVVMAARRPSTRAIYRSRWRRFCDWCSTVQKDPFNCPVTSVLSYLRYLADSGLNATTIRGYVAAISIFTRSPDECSLFQIGLVRQFLKGIVNMFPPRPPVIEPWDLKLVLSVLQGPPFEPLHLCEMQLLSWKTIFLLAISSARRIGEIQALCADEPYTRIEPTKVVLKTKPSFLPKVVSPFHLSQSLVLPAFYPPPHPGREERRLHRLCPRRALVYYLQRSSECRHDRQLFVGYMGKRKGKWVGKQTLSKWVVSLIRKCYEIAGKTPPQIIKAHSTRGAAATTAFLGGVPLDKICQAATWSSGLTFARHYNLDTAARGDTVFGSSVLHNSVTH